MAESMNTEGSYGCATCGEPLNIIGIIQHDCERILSAESLSQSERATLMYVESRMVDNSAELDPKQMNYEDFQNLKVFGAAGILDVDEDPHPSHYKADNPKVMKFTDLAWDLARDCRQMRAATHLDGDEVDLGDVDG